MWDGLANQITAHGFELRLVSNAKAIGGANGLTDYMTREVSVRMDMDDAAQVKILAHELGHVMLHGPDNADAAMHRGIAEAKPSLWRSWSVQRTGLDYCSGTKSNDQNFVDCFDLAREVRPLHVTSPRAIHRF